MLSHESLQPDIKHMTAAANEELLAATDDGDISRALAAVAAGASLTAALTAGGSNALHNAAFEGHAQLCVALIDAGAAVEARRRDGVTALEIAARNGHSETVRTLSLVAAAASDAAKVQATSRTDAAAGSAASTARPTPPPPAGSASASSSRIPVVDWRRAETDREGFLADILHALSEVGFMCLTEHPHFDAEIQARTMAQAHRFFDAPAEIQATASIANTPHFRGHAPPAYTPSQLSELFMYGPAAQKPRADYTDEDVPAWQRIFYGPNTWPGGNFLFPQIRGVFFVVLQLVGFPKTRSGLRCGNGERSHGPGPAAHPGTDRAEASGSSAGDSGRDIGGGSSVDDTPSQQSASLGLSGFRTTIEGYCERYIGLHHALGELICDALGAPAGT